jgi:hypothetical protein
MDIRSFEKTLDVVDNDDLNLYARNQCKILGILCKIKKILDLGRE